MPSKPPAKQKAKRATFGKPTPTVAAKSAVDRRGLSLFLQQAVGFRLALALYNDLMERDSVIRSISEELAPAGIRVLTLDLRQVGEKSLLSHIKELVAGAKIAESERVAIMVVNLEGRVDYAPELGAHGEPGTEFLATANLHRDLLPGVCPAPLVLWMTELLERAFVQYAPDLWHWRNHVFDLRVPRIQSEEARAVKDEKLKSYDDRLHPEDRLYRLEEELAAYRKAGARFDEGRALNSIGWARLDAGDARLARKDFEFALKIARELGNRRAEARWMGDLGIAHAEMGEARKAIELYEQALVISRDLGDRREEGILLGNLGIAHSRLDDTTKAIEFYEQQLAIAREIGDRHTEGNALGNIGICHKNLGNGRRAIEFHEQALAISRETRDRRGEGRDVGNLGNAYAALGDARKAIEFYERQLVIAREVGDRLGAGNALWNSALALHFLGERADARARGEAALQIFEVTEHSFAPKARAVLEGWRREQVPV